MTLAYYLSFSNKYMLFNEWINLPLFIFPETFEHLTHIMCQCLVMDLHEIMWALLCGNHNNVIAIDPS